MDLPSVKVRKSRVLQEKLSSEPEQRPSPPRLSLLLDRPVKDEVEKCYTLFYDANISTHQHQYRLTRR